jgi:nitroimidazol reductase NimA-like FMN-containing flavoprotein (pyridoxamine 5'-phosphate oxidase superfamily)
MPNIGKPKRSAKMFSAYCSCKDIAPVAAVNVGLPYGMPICYPFAYSNYNLVWHLAKGIKLKWLSPLIVS